MEDKPLHIVTGASGGIGQALTERLAKQGYRVLMACRNPEKSEPILTRIRKRSGNPKSRCCRWIWARWIRSPASPQN